MNVTGTTENRQTLLGSFPEYPWFNKWFYGQDEMLAMHECPGIDVKERIFIAGSPEK